MKGYKNSDVCKSINASLKSFSEDKSLDLNYEETYKNLRWELNRILCIFKYIEGRLEKKKPIKLLEVGIGYGMVTTGIFAYFEKEDIKIHAVEHPDRIYLKSKKYNDHLKKTRVNIEKVDILKDKLPYNDSMFDVVVFSEIMEHIPPTRLPFTLKEMSRILNFDGILICTSPNLAGWRVRWKVLRGKSPFDHALPLDWAPGTFGHIRLYTIREMIYLCNVCNLRVEHFKYVNFELLNRYGLTPIVKKAVYNLFPALSPEFIFVAKKAI